MYIIFNGWFNSNENAYGNIKQYDSKYIVGTYLKKVINIIVLLNMHISWNIKTLVH